MIDNNVSNQDDKSQLQERQEYLAEIRDIDNHISNYEEGIRTAKHKIRLYFVGILLCFAVDALIIYESYLHWPWIQHNFTSNSSDTTFTTIFSIIFIWGLLSLSYIFIAIAFIIREQFIITSNKVEKGKYEARKKITNIMYQGSLKSSYFDRVVEVNLAKLEEYYNLIRSHASNSYKIVVVMCVFGFLLIVGGIIIAFFTHGNSSVLTFISSASGIITEIVSVFFFSLYNRTVSQLKEYHNSLLAVQNVLLSFKLIGDTKSEEEKSKLVSQVLSHLAKEQSSSLKVENNE